MYFKARRIEDEQFIPGRWEKNVSNQNINFTVAELLFVGITNHILSIYSGETIDVTYIL